MKKEIWLAASALPLLITASAVYAAGTGEEGCAPRERLVDLSGLFSESGVCTKLPEGSRLAIRAFDDQTALTNFRGIKKTWLQNFDKSNPNSITARLDSSIEKAFSLSLKLPPTAPSVIHLTDTINKVHALYNAIDQIRADGETTVDHVNQIEVAIKAFPRQDFGPDLLAMLDHTTRGLDNIRQILFCRLADEERARKTVQAQKECGSTGVLPPLASAFQMFVGPVQIQSRERSVSDGAVRSTVHEGEATFTASTPVCSNDEAGQNETAAALAGSALAVGE